jgi:hypothetical protein
LTRSPLQVFLLALLDGAIGAAILTTALSHGGHRDVLVHFFAYLLIVLFFKARDAISRLGTLVAAARGSSKALSLGPWWLRISRLLVGYDSWSRTERLGIVVISVIVCTLFGWDDGGPFAAALFLAIAAVNAGLAVVAWGARLSSSKRG